MSNCARRRVEVYAFKECGDGSAMFAVPQSFERFEDEAMMAPAMLTLHNDEAQGLIDALWEAGLRPTEGTGSAGALAATQKHLEDFRKLTFKLMEMS